MKLCNFLYQLVDAYGFSREHHVVRGIRSKPLPRNICGQRLDVLISVGNFSLSLVLILFLFVCQFPASLLL